MPDARKRNVVVALFALALFAASLRPIRSFDYFWHLATGRWIVEHRALPLTDPFAVASAKTPWINGEWLFEAATYPVWQLLGHRGIGMLRALTIALAFGLLFLRARRDMATGPALLLASLSWYGSAQFLGERPATAGVLLLLLFLLLLFDDGGEAGGTEGPARRPWLTPLACFAVTAVWMNVHPSALLAPVLAAVVGVVRLAESPENRRDALRWLAPVPAAAAGLLVTPWGVTGVLAPLHLVQTIRSADFVNLEWLPATPANSPIFFLTLVVAGALMLVRPARRDWARAAVFGLLALLVFRFVRNTPFFFAALPIVAAPAIGRREGPFVARAAFAGAAMLVVAAAIGRPPALGVDHTIFPVAATKKLAALDARGNIFNADQFGGYLIWTFYPERRVLQDGRNELYSSFLAEYAAARRDSRAWDRLQARYGVALAVVDYEAPLPAVNPMTGQSTMVPASLAFFPRRHWALLAFDDAGMVFARRERWSGPPLQGLEYRAVVPDDPSPQFGSRAAAEEALREVARAEGETGKGVVTARLRAAAALVN